MICFPTNPDLADILGKTSEWHSENSYFGIFWIPNFQIFRFPDFQMAWAWDLWMRVLGAEYLKDGVRYLEIMMARGAFEACPIDFLTK